VWSVYQAQEFCLRELNVSQLSWQLTVTTRGQDYLSVSDHFVTDVCTLYNDRELQQT